MGCNDYIKKLIIENENILYQNFDKDITKERIIDILEDQDDNDDLIDE